MKQEELQQRARKELSALNIIGIPDVYAVREAKESLEAEKTETQKTAAYAPAGGVDSTTVEPTVVDITTEEHAPEAKVDIRSNYHKFDNDVSDILAGQQTRTEQVIYHRLYRLSYGFGRNTCQVGMGALAKACNIGSSGKTVRKAIEGLVAKGHIAVIEHHGNAKRGTKYRVFLPFEIAGIESGTIVKTTIVDSTIVKPTVVKKKSTVVENTIVENTTEGSHAAGPTTSGTVVENTIVDSPPNKDINKDNLKDSLSPRAIVSGFYNGIGQARISKEKRERAESNFKELLGDGFDPGDIQFAVEWTLKNAKEELYDFSIVKHTIGQAMVAKKKAEEGEAKKRERERIATQEEAEERRRAEEERQIKAYKESLDADERVRLRQRAEAEIKNSGKYRAEFVTDYLIEAMENNLIRGRIGVKLSE